MPNADALIAALQRPEYYWKIPVSLTTKLISTDCNLYFISHMKIPFFNTKKKAHFHTSRSPFFPITTFNLACILT